jgi:very-short-patch-repair endonuclease
MTLTTANGRDRALVRLASTQYGVVSTRQLRSLALDKSAVRHRVVTGHLHPLHRGVYAVGRGDLTDHGRWLAAVLAVGEGAVLSHRSAAALWGFAPDGGRESDIAAEPDVAVARSLRPRSGVRIHRARNLPRRDTTLRQRIPVTTAARTLVDLADVVGDQRELRRAVNEALVQHRVSVPVLRRQVDARATKRGRARLATLLRRGRATPTRSELEDRLFELLDRHGLPRPLTNQHLRELRGAPEVDFLFAEQMVVIEADGDEYHDTALARRADAAKQALLEASGYRVLRVDWEQATLAEAQTAARVRLALAQAAPPPARPPPRGV